MFTALNAIQDDWDPGPQGGLWRQALRSFAVVGDS